MKSALTRVIEGWRVCRHPRLADLVDHLSSALLRDAPREELGTSRGRADRVVWWEVAELNDAMDFPRLSAAARGGSQQEVLQRVEALAQRNDPRFGAAMLTMLEDPPYAGLKSRDLLAQIVFALAETRDKRLAGRARDLAARIPGIVASGTGGWLSEQLEMLATQLDDVPAPELSDELQQLCGKWEQHLGIQPPRIGAGLDIEALTMAVYEQPDDDGCRLVLADALTERDDPRGLFIALQVARARGAATPEGLAREREILRDAEQIARWTHPLTNAGVCALERGFVASVNIYTKMPPRLIGHPSWATVSRVDNLLQLSGKRARMLVEAPSMKSLRHVDALKGSTVNQLLGREWPWHSLKIVEPERMEAGALRRFPALRSLTLHRGTVSTAALLEPLAELTHLELSHVAHDGLALPVLDSLAMTHTSWSEPLPASLRKLTISAVAFEDGELCAGLEELRVLDLAWRQGGLPRGLFDPIPSLDTLVLRSFRTSFDTAQLAPLTRLRVLDAEWCALTPSTLATMTRLEVLRCATLPLDQVPEVPLQRAVLQAPEEAALVVSFCQGQALLSDLTLQSSTRPSATYVAQLIPALSSGSLRRLELRFENRELELRLGSTGEIVCAVHARDGAELLREAEGVARVELRYASPACARDLADTLGVPVALD